MIEMNLAIAEQVARAAQTKARELGTPMTVSVVDEAGRLVYTARGDGAGFFSVKHLAGQPSPPPTSNVRPRNWVS
jgi:uncharacterized protein GlcG (DUF336 family)